MAPRIKALPMTDGFRGWACLMVVAWHAWLTVIPEYENTLQRVLMVPFGAAARTILVIFIVLSGLLLGRHWPRRWREEGWRTTSWIYLKRRTMRIVPAFWAALVLVLIALFAFGLRNPSGSHWDNGLPFEWSTALKSFLLITDFTFDIPLSHQFWTVPTEFHLYLLGALIIFLPKRAAIVVAATALVGGVIVFAPEYFAPYFPFAFAMSFWLGVKRQSIETITLRETIRLVLPFAIASLALAVLVVLAGTTTVSIRNYFVTDALFGPIFMVWLLHHDITGRTYWFDRWQLWGPLKWLGYRSYTIYLLHGIVLELLWRALFVPFDAGTGPHIVIGMIVIGCALTVVAAIPFYDWIEAPTARMSARIGRASRVAPPADPVP